MNYENILKALNNLKIEISSDIAKNCDNADIEYMHNSLNELSGNVEILRNISTQKYQEITDNITATLKDFSNEISQKINSENNLNFEELKTVFNNLISEFDTVKSEFLKINDSTAFSISSGFSNVNTIFETVFAGINSLGENFDNVSKQNAQNILGRINDIILGFEELKLELNSSVYVDKIIGSINSVSTKIDELYEKDNYREDFDKIKDALAIIKSETDISREEYSRELKENVNIQTEQIRNVSENIDSLKTYINDIGENLKNYISETEAVRVSNNSQSEEKTTQKLLDLETALTQNVQNYEEQFKNLQSKLMEFVHIVEGSNSDTEGKIISSLEEVSGIKDELISLNDILKNISSTNSEKFNETISLLDAGVENIVFNINNINDSLKNGVENSVKENILSLEEKFVELTDILNILKKESSEFDEKLINDISEKITSMKDEISLVNTDITDAVQCKTNEILRSLEPLKLNLETIADIDLEKLLSEFKSEFEIYFRNFKDDLNKESEANSEAFSDIKQSYKEILNKISIVEEVVNKTLQNNIELLSISLESGLRGINSDFDEKLNNLKLYFDIALNNTRNQDAINELREQLFKAFESLKNEQSRCIISKANELSANVLNLSGTVKSGNKNIIKGLEIVDKRVGNKLANVNELVTALNTKVDVLASDKSDENLLDEIDEIKDIVKSLVEELKLDNSDIKEGLEIVDKKVGNKLANVNELITTLNAKVDVLASDDSDENLLDEIDEIKDIIFEQRKYFESASDEKSAAMDKYLKDVLLKLDNIDIQKNSEDIKETVLNAVLSLSDQISFVEETEDIKDFVEEKTDSIHQSLIQVHNQLKQLTSGDNDFEYTYTLQDVESDIAKLRLAMNNISVGKFEDISDEIKKIVLSVENLETNLTQDQIIDLRTDIEKINDDIISISSRTNKLLLNSDESYKAVNDGLNNFSNLILKLEDRINYLDNSELTKRIENKINNVEVISTVNANSNKVITQAMIYLGEWVDATTQDISSISDKISSIAENTSQISDIKDTVEKIKELIPDNTEIINELQEKFAHQEERIDNLERKLDQIISTLEEKNDMVLNRKADKIEKLLSEVGANIEKLTSYVDEE
ncbi:hypothetical protein J6P92_08990 [bacterium]|nr:hypothetical protein [bacterium]